MTDGPMLLAGATSTAGLQTVKELIVPSRLSIILFALALPLPACSLAQPQNVPQTNGHGAIGVYCMPEANGCRIHGIVKDGPAERAGLRNDDLLLPLNPSDHASAVEQIVRNSPGTKITLPFQRGHAHMQAAITVEDQLAIALRGAARGDAAAEETLGGIYQRGVGVPKNSAEALKWFRKAADQGYDVREYDLGYSYAQGDGIPRDERTAVEWFRKAAEQGFEPGQTALGEMYIQGAGVAMDQKAAVEWFRKAAAKGFAKAEFDLGWSYENGFGVAKDMSAAIPWYKKAAEHGYDPARQKLAKLQQ